ncbi:MAG: tRNA adenosine(34) deaminase TadA [Moraxella sp.]|nr:tRNA adenosine(34) deaminase TadA [Moraxella sp.]
MSALTKKSHAHYLQYCQENEFDEADHQCMQLALQLAKQGASVGEVPVGAVIMMDGQVVGAGFNCPISTCDATAHAEIVAIRQACQSINNYRLPPNSTLYVTLEPCTMCFGALVHARVGRIVFGASEPKAGVIVSQLSLPSQPFYNHMIQVQGGLLQTECSALLSDFFKKRRADKKQSG